MLLIEQLLMKASAPPSLEARPFLNAWGTNNSGNLGDGTTTNRSSPVQIGTSSWAAVSTGGGSSGFHSAAIRSDGALFTWGSNTNGQLGTFTIIVGVFSWTAVAAGFSHAGAIRANGGLYLWGANFFGQLGQNNIINTISPVQVGTRSFTLISLSRYHTIAR